MPSFLSSFAAGGTAQSFSARVQGHTEDVKSTVLIHVSGVFANTAAWGQMARLRTWKYSVREVPGAADVASGVVVQILGGPSWGTLIVDSYNTWAAILIDMGIDHVSPRTGLVFGHLTFLMQPS